ncbi:MAG: hypothetical protein DRP56_05120, partial [Planctomycetota bacterium]
MPICMFRIVGDNGQDTEHLVGPIHLTVKEWERALFLGRQYTGRDMVLLDGEKVLIDRETARLKLVNKAAKRARRDYQAERPNT